jgi:sulfonate transport system ATP-binding protein
MIQIRNLTVSYQADGALHTALDGIDFALAAGETCAIIGPSGSGKSTLLKVLAGIIKQYQGSVEIDGQPVRPQEQKIGFIPQDYGLLPWRNVYENSCLGVKLKRQWNEETPHRLENLLQQLGLSGLENRYPGELSGGQQQRVALARSFLLRPDLLLMDEPFSALDAMSREEIQDLFLRVWRKHAVSTVLVTHQVEEAVYLGQKIVVLSPSPGRIHKVIDNPLFGLDDIRNQPSFFALCSSLRKTVKEDWAK